MNNVLITGLGNGILGSDCSPCNYNYMQLIDNPSILLWIDKLTVSDKIWDVILNAKHPNDKVARIVNVIMEYFDNNGMVEIIHSDMIFTNDVKDSIEQDVKNDARLINDTYSNFIKLTEDGAAHEYLAIVNGYNFCFPKLLSIYGDLYMAHKLGANCLFSEEDLSYCNLKFGLTYQSPRNDINIISGVDKILENIIPDIHTLPHYIYEGEVQCNSCAYDINNCELDYLKHLGKTMKQYSEWREYDEFHILRDNINEIINVARRDKNIIMPEDVYIPFNERKERVNRMIHKRLPRVKKFVNLITALSAPITIASIGTGNTGIAIGSAITQSVSALSSTVINSMEEKYKWVNFTLKQ